LTLDPQPVIIFRHMSADPTELGIALHYDSQPHYDGQGIDVL